MTYKIADILIQNDYVLPIENKNINNKKIILPRIEIDKLLKGKNQKKLGDFDILFYSPYTNVLYNLEYKNYQMMITEEGCLHKEIEKVKDDNVVIKTLEREKYLLENLQIVKKCLFSERIEIKDVKTIILTTKPNLYFYVNENNFYLYYEWNEFKSKVINKVI